MTFRNSYLYTVLFFLTFSMCSCALTTFITHTNCTDFNRCKGKRNILQTQLQKFDTPNNLSYCFSVRKRST